MTSPGFLLTLAEKGMSTMHNLEDQMDFERRRKTTGREKEMKDDQVKSEVKTGKRR